MHGVYSEKQRVTGFYVPRCTSVNGQLPRVPDIVKFSLIFNLRLLKMRTMVPQVFNTDDALPY